MILEFHIKYSAVSLLGQKAFLIKYNDVFISWPVNMMYNCLFHVKPVDKNHSKCEMGHTKCCVCTHLNFQVDCNC